ncbi:Spx/MgsR family RNA polymerase-binding regulatory protein [Cohnella pontilimi]|uniref:Spx/MgsR family RNA polymerase-binding regulatory protein n=1 Tax=Cohnella pontilimi TaxID=2564100 RepID=A0A4U0F8F9_9BACL|nr:Spx/MgsR family RNA polymerase-binding regulatory protein [Cohnella pontilimi]TJY41023.1 Spx/MgsR family RNA polymerase-binding regulatory protein [Cohnella pontilimi]
MKDRKLTVYHYPPCSTCRMAVKRLHASGYELILHNLWEEAPSAKELKKWIGLSGLPISKWFNVSGEVYRKLGLKDKLPGMSDDEKIAVLASNGRLIKRPVVTDGERVTVGFKEDEYSRVW